DYLADKTHWVGCMQKRWQTIDLECLGTKGFHPDPHFLQGSAVVLDPLRVTRRQLEGRWQKQSLRWHPLRLHSAAEFFKQDSFMSCVLIDQDKAISILHQDVKIIQHADDLELGRAVRPRRLCRCGSGKLLSILSWIG